MKGRMREKPRKDIKKMTFRINFNGTLKFVKCFKTKLWGYEKNKKLRELVYKFQNGVWKDADDHTVERLSAIQLRQGDNSLRIERVFQKDDDILAETELDEEEEKGEMKKNNKVLANILGNFDFDKELDYKEDVNLDVSGNSDFEYEGALDYDEDVELEPVDLSQIEYVKEGEFDRQSASAQVDNLEDDDDDEEDEIYDKADMGFSHQKKEKETPFKDVGSEEPDNDENVEVEQAAAEEEEEEEEEGEENSVEEDNDEVMDVDSSDEDTEFVPTFGQASTTKEEAQAQSSNLTSGTVSNTEVLRGLFNPEDETTFKLIEEEDEDIDKSKKPVESDIKLPDFEISPIISKSKAKKSLFFTHLESPFLVAQTQVNKLNSNVEFGNWGEEFWEKRSEWTRDLKRRRRDVLRQLRKKNAKNSKVFV
jgi:nucleolar protein 8